MDRNVEGHFVQSGLTDITPAQANALMVLFEAREAMTARRLAEALSLSEVTVGRFLRALESRGWVARERDPSDSRAILVSPTPKARESLPRFIDVTNALMDQAFAGLPDARLAVLLDGIRHVRENLDPQADTPSDP
jgi:DNA-binding MarR family transcriptional regulator